MITARVCSLSSHFSVARSFGRSLPRNYRHTARATHWNNIEYYTGGHSATKPIEKDMSRYNGTVDFYGNKKVNYDERLPGTSGGARDYFSKNGLIDPTRKSLNFYKSQDYRRRSANGEMHI